MGWPKLVHTRCMLRTNRLTEGGNLSLQGACSHTTSGRGHVETILDQGERSNLPVDGLSRKGGANKQCTDTLSRDVSITFRRNRLCIKALSGGSKN